MVHEPHRFLRRLQSKIIHFERNSECKEGPTSVITRQTQSTRPILWCSYSRTVFVRYESFWILEWWNYLSSVIQSRALCKYAAMDRRHLQEMYMAKGREWDDDDPLWSIFTMSVGLDNLLAFISLRPAFNGSTYATCSNFFCFALSFLPSQFRMLDSCIAVKMRCIL